MQTNNKGSALRRDVPADIAAKFSQPPRRSDAASIPRNVPVYLPEIFPIPDAVEFNPSGSATSVGAETGTAITMLPTISNALVKLPDQNIGILRGFAVYITNMLTTTNVSWTLMINGSPAGGYGAIKLFPRASAFVGNSFDCFIRIPDGAKVGVEFTNTDGGSYIIGASFSGWYWPIASGKRWLESSVSLSFGGG